MSAGTLDYMAPEVLRCPLKRQPGDNKDRHDLFYSQAVDAWAVGVLSYELLTGRCVSQCVRNVSWLFPASDNFRDVWLMGKWVAARCPYVGLFSILNLLSGCALPATAAPAGRISCSSAMHQASNTPAFRSNRLLWSTNMTLSKHNWHCKRRLILECCA
jgi:serine/threonine protein kinase